MKLFIPIVTIVLMSMLTACEIDDPGKETENEEEEEAVPTFTYRIVETGVTACYNNFQKIDKPSLGDPFYGQDGNYRGFNAAYEDNGDGTVTDKITGLMWQQEMGVKASFKIAKSSVPKMNLGGYTDWRLPTAKELYSLIRFTGKNGGTPASSILFINSDYFIQPWGDTTSGERYIDAQTWSATEYVGTTMNNDETVFGVNFVDGRIKGYPKFIPGTSQPNEMYFRMVRGNPSYGFNDFIDHSDGTISDLATGLMWQQADDGTPRDWEEALAYAETLEHAGHSDWRLPNAKEMQSIVDYSRAPDITGSPAIDPMFYCTEIDDPEGNGGQYPYYWTGTTHLDGPDPESAAVYIAFGEAQGWMQDQLMDLHGAGAQRSDPKSGDPGDYPSYWGPQGDVRYVYNYVRCVRDIPLK
ncbi:MAG: DUF1566 domain-containing protein [Bacteroidota bacterium]